jgi:hypothetical protein
MKSSSTRHQYTRLGEARLSEKTLQREYSVSEVTISVRAPFDVDVEEYGLEGDGIGLVADGRVIRETLLGNFLIGFSLGRHADVDVLRVGELERELDSLRSFVYGLDGLAAPHCPVHIGLLKGPVDVDPCWSLIGLRPWQHPGKVLLSVFKRCHCFRPWVGKRGQELPWPGVSFRIATAVAAVDPTLHPDLPATLPRKEPALERAELP